MKVVCQHYLDCKEHDCAHKEVHYKEDLLLPSSCDNFCRRTNQAAHCRPLESEESNAVKSPDRSAVKTALLRPNACELFAMLGKMIARIGKRLTCRSLKSVRSRKS